MYCPECRAEYRPGFSRCSDCDVDLVDELPDADSASQGALTLVWECDDQSECVGVCRDLKNADIPYKVDQISYERAADMRVDWRYRILVSPDDLERAKQVAGIEAPQYGISSSDVGEEEVFDPSVELPDTSSLTATESKRRDTYLDPWYPEDATVEVWSQDGEDISSGIALALDANRIHCRCGCEAAGAKKIFVRPDDESFAREIVREIIEGTPLN